MNQRQFNHHQKHSNNRNDQNSSASPKASKPYHRRQLRVTESCRLLEFLLSSLKEQSAASVKALLRHRCIILNDNQILTQFDYPLEPGNVISIISQNESRFGLFHPKLKILFEDDYIIIVHKDSGLHSVDSTHGGCDNAAAILDSYLKKRDPQKRIYIVHRLDRDTSGVLVFAKCREAQNKLIADWNERVLERTYIAIIEGKLPDQKGTIDSWLYEDSHKIVHSTDDPSKGLRAITHYEVLQSNQTYSRLKLNLETGRTNQIRVHLQSLGHPIIGDEKYGSNLNPIDRLGLHALTLCFRHPISQQTVSFTDPEPKEFGDLFERP